MRRHLHYIRIGLRDHPGILPLIMLTVLGFVAGGPLGAAIMLSVFGTCVLWSSWDSGRHESAARERLKGSGA